MAPDNNNSNSAEMKLSSLSQHQSVSADQQLSGSIVDNLFRDWLPRILNRRRHLTDIIKSVNQWNITRDSNIVAIWTLDLKNGAGDIYEGLAKCKPDCILTVDENDMYAMFTGSLEPGKAFMLGKMKIGGNLSSAHKFQQFWAEELMSGSLKELNERLAQTANAGSNAPEVCSVNSEQEEALLQNIPIDGLKSDIVFNIIKARMDEEPELVKAIKFVIQFNITRNGKVVAVWTTDTKVEGGEVYRSLPKVKPDAIVNVDDENYVKILFGKLNPQRAFMTGKIGVKGNILLLQKLDSFWNSVQGQRNDPEMPIVKEIMLKDPLKPGLRSEVIIFDLIQKMVRLPNLLDEGTSVQFDINKDGRLASKWRLNYPVGQQIGMLERADTDRNQNCTLSLTVEDNDFVRLAYNTIKLEDAIASGRIKLSGDSSPVPKLSKMFTTSTIKAKL